MGAKVRYRMWGWFLFIGFIFALGFGDTARKDNRLLAWGLFGLSMAGLLLGALFGRQAAALGLDRTDSIWGWYLFLAVIFGIGFGDAAQKKPAHTTVAVGLLILTLTCLCSSAYFGFTFGAF
ncbi:MAG TPA: hypothetical protein VD862_04175 [Candidatus Paceibacterota bacterium]|nr:hypothetical protein [Candidatus Paceibacterota bacterium]